jgi:hypothetical protein
MNKTAGFGLIIIVLLWIVVMDWAVFFPDSFNKVLFGADELDEVSVGVEGSKEIIRKPEIKFEELIINEQNDTKEEKIVDAVEEIVDEVEEPESITFSVANWHINGFGKKTTDNETKLELILDIIRQYDIIFVQGIQDSSGSAFNDLCLELSSYECRLSERTGESQTKEQYGVVYANDIEIVEWKDYSKDNRDEWERSPLMVKFKLNDFTFNAYNIHIDKDEALTEMEELEDIVINSGNVMVLGNLYADCDFYNMTHEKDFKEWDWVIDNNEDTFVLEEDCAFDRIILNEELSDKMKDSGIYNEDIKKDISNHYLIWVEFEV